MPDKNNKKGAGRARFFDHRKARRQRPSLRSDLYALTKAANQLTLHRQKITQTALAAESGISVKAVRDLWPELTRKSCRVELRCSPLERVSLDAKATLAQSDRSSLILSAVRRANIKILPTGELHALNTWLNRIHAQLNQIARYCNTYAANAEGARILAALLDLDQEIRVNALMVQHTYADREQEPKNDH